MAEYDAFWANTWQTTTDMSQALYHGVRGVSQYLCALGSNPGDTNLIGILTNKVPVFGGFCTVAWLGKCKMYAGGAVPAWSPITVNGSGRAAVATSGQYALGRALETAANDGDIITVMLGGMPQKQ